MQEGGVGFFLGWVCTVWYRLWMEHTGYHNRIIESSFAYHTMDEAMEHWRFKKGRLPLPHEEEEIKAGLTYDGEHIWRNENSHVGMYWWRRDDS